MAPGNGNACLPIVRTIPGQSTAGWDDRYVTADGRVWQRQPSDHGTATTAGTTGYLRGSHVCFHR